MKLKSLFILTLVVFTFLSWKFIDQAGAKTTRFQDQHLKVTLRNIAHQLLLSAGDTTSRVLPVINLGTHSFLLQFQNQIAIQPDTLVAIFQFNMKDEGTTQEYIVEVLSCLTKEIVYAFEIYEDKESNLVPCLGRSLPLGCYDIKMTIPNKQIASAKYIPLMVSFIACVFSFFLLLKKKGKEMTGISNTIQSTGLQLGHLWFFPDKQLLKSGKESISLTTKENQVLRILASKPNQILSRDQLQKEVWEDEGVLVGRSLDVFISKLRKKLEPDPNLKIVNAHGKGYRLEM